MQVEGESEVNVRAMVLYQPGRPLQLEDVPTPEPGPGQVLLHVHACGICRTDLHIVDGELPPHKHPVIPGHQIVGTVVATGSEVSTIELGQRVGVPWLAWTDGTCEYCASGRENLCDHARFTGYDVDGGFAEYTVADARYCFPIPDGYADDHAAPLLCAGLIGFRSLRFTGDAQRLGIYGFGAAAHIVTQVARWQGRDVYAFTRTGDAAAQDFARELGASWAGASDETSPVPLDSAIIFAPVGELVVRALRAVHKGGTVVCGGIHMTDIPAFSYDLLWGERVIRSIANLTREDGLEFLDIAARVPVETVVRKYPLAEANEALSALRSGEASGALVLLP